LAAEAAFAGEVVLPDRTALTRSVASIGGLTRVSMRQATDRAVQRLAEFVQSAPASDLLGGRIVREAGESAVDEALERHRSGGRLTDDEVAWLTLLLSHVPVRDLAWQRTNSEDWQIALWTEVLRRAEPDLAAAPASLLAFTAWRAGNGPLASVALERALRADPAYPMALLLDDVLRNGVDPSTLDGWPEAGRSRARGGPSRGGKPSRGGRRGKRAGRAVTA
jgi:hypothetical protein